MSTNKYPTEADRKYYTKLDSAIRAATTPVVMVKISMNSIWGRVNGASIEVPGNVFGQVAVTPAVSSHGRNVVVSDNEFVITYLETGNMIGYTGMKKRLAMRLAYLLSQADIDWTFVQLNYRSQSYENFVQTFKQLYEDVTEFRKPEEV